MATMTKKQYKAISDAFKQKVEFKQYLYATRGFDKDTGWHNKEGRDFHTYFKELDSIAFQIANALSDANSKFDREKFLEECGMKTDGISYLSFSPPSDYIKAVQRV